MQSHQCDHILTIIPGVDVGVQSDFLHELLQTGPGHLGGIFADGRQKFLKVFPARLRLHLIQLGQFLQNPGFLDGGGHHSDQIEMLFCVQQVTKKVAKSRRASAGRSG